MVHETTFLGVEMKQEGPFLGGDGPWPRDRLQVGRSIGDIFTAGIAGYEERDSATTLIFW